MCYTIIKERATARNKGVFDMSKLYPFSTAKHAHDIEYRLNRVYIEMREQEDDRNYKENYNELCDLHEALLDLLQAVLNSSDGRVCWLTGKQYGLAKECVLWASCKRGG